MATRNRDKQRKDLAKRRKRRAGHAGRSLVNIKPASARVVERVSRDNVDLLQNIESVLVDCYRADPFDTIDDAVVMKALRHSLLDMEPDDSAAGLLGEALLAVRRLRSHVPDGLWNDALRVVMSSVQNHSSAAPGDTAYLDFVEHYFP